MFPLIMPFSNTYVVMVKLLSRKKRKCLEQHIYYPQPNFGLKNNNCCLLLLCTIISISGIV